MIKNSRSFCRLLKSIGLALLFASSTLDVWAGEVGTQKAGDLTVSFSTDPNPSRVGKNLFKVALRGPDGNTVTDAKVTLLATMPGMEAMMGDVKAVAKVRGEEYTAEADLSMEGKWRVRVNILRKGQSSLSASFDFEVLK